MKKVCLFFMVILLASCTNYSPKPYGYFRIDFPEHSYREFNQASYPYKFELSESAIVSPRQEKNWIDIFYPRYKAQLHCSYKQVNKNFQDLSEDSHSLAYKHIVRADGIDEYLITLPAEKVYGIFYDLDGNTASPIQFMLTDSTRNFFRAALYFNVAPNADSIAPVKEFFREELLHLIETFEWKLSKP